MKISPNFLAQPALNVVQANAKMKKRIKSSKPFKPFITIILMTLCGCNSLSRILGDRHSQTQGPPANALKIIVVGQSNGVSGINAGDQPTWSRTTKVWIEDHSIGWALSIPVTMHRISSSLSWVMLGDLYYERTGRMSVFYNLAHGNQSTRDWKNKWCDDFWHTAQQIQPDAILWVQGESDTQQMISSEESYQNLCYIFETAKMVAPNAKIFIALDGRSIFPAELEDSNIRVAEHRIIDEGRALPGPDLDLMRRQHPDWFEASLYEFTGNGFQGHAAGWYDVLSKYF